MAAAGAAAETPEVVSGQVAKAMNPGEVWLRPCSCRIPIQSPCIARLLLYQHMMKYVAETTNARGIPTIVFIVRQLFVALIASTDNLPPTTRQ
jgi:hypothetical protein